MFHSYNVYIHFNLARYDLVSTDLCNSVWAGVYNSFWVGVYCSVWTDIQDSVWTCVIAGESGIHPICLLDTVPSSCWLHIHLPSDPLCTPAGHTQTVARPVIVPGSPCAKCTKVVSISDDGEIADPTLFAAKSGTTMVNSCMGSGVSSSAGAEVGVVNCCAWTDIIPKSVIFDSPSCDRFLLATFVSWGEICFKIGNHVFSKLVAWHLL